MDSIDAMRHAMGQVSSTNSTAGMQQALANQQMNYLSGQQYGPSLINRLIVGGSNLSYITYYPIHYPNQKDVLTTTSTNVLDDISIGYQQFLDHVEKSKKKVVGKSGSILLRLRSEIDSWHGNVLERLAA